MVKFKAQRGYLLTETLLALLIGALLLTSLVKVVTAVFANIAYKQALDDITEKLRYLQLYWTRVFRLEPSRCPQSANLPGLRLYPPENPKELILGRCTYYHSHYQYVKTHFFVANSHRLGHSGRQIFSFYEKVAVGHRQEIVADVGEMQVDYILPNHRQCSADRVHDWSQVQAVCIHFKICSDRLSRHVKYCNRMRV